jgi:hypothetical protein
MILEQLKRFEIVGIQVGLSFSFVFPLHINSFFNKVWHIFNINGILWVAYFAP